MYDIKKIRGKYNFNEKVNTLNMRTNELIENGINYNEVVHLYDIFIEDYLKLIGVDSCYLLFYLIAHAHNKEYLNTTIGIIQPNINMSKDKISNTLKTLHKNKLINIKALKSFSKDIGMNDILQIVILYGNDMLYNQLFASNEEVYKTIPIDYIKYALLELNSTEFTILLCLILKFKYYLPIVTKDRLGNPFSTYSVHEYATINLDQISDYFNSTRKTVKKYIMTLAEKKYISYEPSESGGISNKLDRETKEYYSLSPNYLYRINLLQRVEYLYYNYFKSNDMNKNILEKDYIRYTYSSEMNLLNIAIKNKDLDVYNKLDKVIIQNFSNKEVKNIKKIENRKSPEKEDCISDYVYVLKMSGMENIYKIGKTTNFIKRVGEYTKLPMLPELIKLIQVQDCSKIESYFHDKFKEQRLRGEWFKLDENIIKYFITSEYINDIKESFIKEIDYEIAR